MPESERVYLNRWEIENFLAVKALTVDARGNHVVLAGPNNIGKSSALDAIWLALGGVGKGTRPLEQPIHAGAEKAVVTVDLGKYKVTRKWTPAGTTLVVETAEGFAVKSPQALLTGLLNDYALNPLAFLALPAREQVTELLRVARIEPPVEAVAEILETEPPKPTPGMSAMEYLDGLTEKSGILYDRRATAKREAEHMAARQLQAEEALCKVGGKPDGTEPPASVEVTARLRELREQAKVRKEAITLAEAAREASDEARNAVDNVRERILVLRAELQDLEAREGILSATANVKNDEAHRLQMAVSAMMDPQPAIDEAEESLGALEEQRDKWKERQRLFNEMIEASRLRQEADSRCEMLDTQIRRLRALRQKLIDGIDFISGLTVVGGSLHLDGAPLSQASTSRQLRVACQLAMRANPGLPLLRIDNGEHLDHASRVELLKIASEHTPPFQVIMTTVAEGDGMRVEIIDAEALADEDASIASRKALDTTLNTLEATPAHLQSERAEARRVPDDADLLEG